MNPNQLPQEVHEQYLLKLSPLDVLALTQTKDYNLSPFESEYFLRKYTQLHNLPFCKLDELSILAGKDNDARARFAIRKADEQFLIDQAKQGVLFGDEILTRILFFWGEKFLFSLYELALSPEQWKQCCLAKSQAATNDDILELGEPSKYFLSACFLAHNSTLLQDFANRENVRLSSVMDIERKWGVHYSVIWVCKYPNHVLFAAAMGNCDYLQLFRESSVCREHRPFLLHWIIKYEQREAFEECLEEDAYADKIELDKYLLVCAKYGRVEYAKRVYQMLGNVKEKQLRAAASKHANFLAFLDKHQELMD